LDWFRNLNMATHVIVVSTISALGWILLEGAVPLVISILAGASIAVKATNSSEE